MAGARSSRPRGLRSVATRPPGAGAPRAGTAPDPEVVTKPAASRRRPTLEETCLKHGVEPSVLTVHSDRAAPMTSQGTARLLARLGVNRSPGRPRVSDDKPYSEAQFKTPKHGGPAP